MTAFASFILLFQIKAIASMICFHPMPLVPIGLFEPGSAIGILPQNLWITLVIFFFWQRLKLHTLQRGLLFRLLKHRLQGKKLQLQMDKPSQDQIDRLANEPDSDGEVYQQALEEEPNYEQQYDKEPEEINYENEQQFQSSAQKESPLNGVSEVQSEIQEENADQIADEIVSEHPSTPGAIDKFKKDQDMSLAKSQFVQSQLLNIDSNLKDKKEQIIKQSSKEKQKQPVKKEKEKSKKTNPTQIKPIQRNIQKEKDIKVKKQPFKVNSGIQEGKEKKEKLSQSQIKQRMKLIQDEKEALLKKKQEKLQKQEQIKRKQYEQAKKLQQQRKEKNKKILEEQKQKKKVDVLTKSQMKIDSEEIKIPEKRAEYKYMDMVKERKEMEKKIKQQIDQDNKNKLKAILQKPQSQLKGQARKAAFLQERKLLKQRQIKQRQMEAKEEDVLVVKQLKKDINQARKFNREKQEQINRTDKTIDDLNKKLKEKEKKFYEKYSKGQSANEQIQINNFSQLTPIEKFVYCFPEAKTSEQIFKLIDSNGDGVLSSQQIKQKLQQYNLQSQVIAKVEQLLDENSDGTVSQEQFIFLVDRELKRQRDYRQIMGILEINDPLDLEAKIIDMQAKIKFINNKIEKSLENKNEEVYKNKLEKLEKKARKLEEEWKKEIQSHQDRNPNVGFSPNTGIDLANQAVKLKNQRNMKANLLDKLRTKVRQNLQEKNKLLASRVQENLRLSEQIFKLKSEIQERQLRYVSLKKIQQNKKGYLQRQSQKQKQLEQAYKKTKQYKIAIADPSKKAQIAAERDQMKLLAAVLMIQRNYRRKKARGEFQKLKAGIQ